MGLVEIEYDFPGSGFADIAHDILFRTATFESQLAATPGMFECTVKDVNQIYDFTTGRELRMSIGGDLYYGGYVTQVEEFYATIVDTSVPANVKVRQFRLRGVDYNLLFDKRILANYASPTSDLGKMAAGITDKDAIAHLVTNLLDLSGLGLDLTSGVEHVGDFANSGQATSWGAPADTWRAAMERVSWQTGGTWYITPEKKLIYTSRESETVSWGFSDRPNKTTTFGSREIRFTQDGSSVVNDAFIWGGTSWTGKVYFGRVQNTDSINDGLRMQYGALHFDQTGYASNKSCLQAASRIVTGAPGVVSTVSNGIDADRGLQNPQRLLSQAWFYGGVPSALHPGQVVTTYLYTFGSPKTIALPLRSLRISFLAPEIVRFDGFFGIQTSDPYSLWLFMKRQQQDDEANVPVFVTTIPDDSTTPVPSGSFTTGTGDGSLIPNPDGGTTVFYLRFPYVTSSTLVYKNGLLQTRGTAYTESDPGTGQITFAVAPLSTDTITATAQATGAGSPTATVAGAFYISPSGNDSTGDGSDTKPWATLAKFLTVAGPGSTLYCRGGTYTGSGNHNISLTSGPSGSPGAPITISAYPGETPVFNGGANGSSDTNVFWIIATGAISHFVIDGITLRNFSMTQDGIVTLSNQASGGSITDWTFRNCDIQQVAPADPSAQFIYMGERFATLLAEDCIFRGPYPSGLVTGGAAISAYADTGPSPTGVTIRRCVFIHCFTGVQFYDTGTSGSVTHNTFIGCRDNIDITHHATITVRDNAGEHGTDADIYDPSPAGTTADHNYWGVSFNPDYTIVSPSPAINGASDGSDAGAVQS